MGIEKVVVVVARNEPGKDGAIEVNAVEAVIGHNENLKVVVILVGETVVIPEEVLEM